MALSIEQKIEDNNSHQSIKFNICRDGSGVTEGAYFNH